MAETKKQKPPARSRIESALYDLTQGLPQRELKLMVTEAAECEEQLQADIVALEQALQGTNSTSKETDLELLDNPYTPLDSYWTASALLGRLRSSDTLACSPLVERPDEQLAPNVVLSSKMAYSLPQTVTQLLTVFKKIASNKTSIVFKRAVKPEEAPGYTDRIKFPMDLSLIRRQIVAQHVTTLKQLHDSVKLIAHNCVKYNGRESDYGRVAREFEATADTILLQAVQQIESQLRTLKKAPPPLAPPSSGTVPPPAAAPSAPSSS